MLVLPTYAAIIVSFLLSTGARISLTNHHLGEFIIDYDTIDEKEIIRHSHSGLAWRVTSFWRV